MDYFGLAFGGVTANNGLENRDRIITGSQNENEVDRKHIGSRFNEWRRPVADYGSNKAEWEAKLKSSPYVGDIEFSREDWATARATVDGVLDLLMKEIKSLSASYVGLVIERYVRQGSARDGLKVNAPDEFDTLLQFHFEGLCVEPEYLLKGGRIVPEFCYLKVNKTMKTLQRTLPQLYKEGVFVQDGNRVRINARTLHQCVFVSIIDKATDRIMKQPRNVLMDGRQCFRLTRKINPPSVNITIRIHVCNEINPRYQWNNREASQLKTINQIDLDIVPGLLLRNDQVPDPSSQGKTMECPVYAVFKWLEETSVKALHFPSPYNVWRVCSSGYEKHTLDLSRLSQRQSYIISALRVMKTYFSKSKNAAVARGQAPPQITTVFRSYHLKHIAFYLILYLCYLHPEVKISGIQDVLRYFITFLMAVLETKCLPHFFHSNTMIRYIFPEFPMVRNQLRFNLLSDKSDEALKQAGIYLDNVLVPDLGFVVLFGTDIQQARLKREFSNNITMGMFF